MAWISRTTRLVSIGLWYNFIENYSNQITFVLRLTGYDSYSNLNLDNSIPIIFRIESYFPRYYEI